MTLMHIDNYVFREVCPLCGSLEVKEIGKLKYNDELKFATSLITLKNTPELWRCSKCESRFTNYIIPENIATSLYSGTSDENRWGSIESDKPINVMNSIKSFIKKQKPDSWLDIGCNTGEFLDFVKTNNIQTYGLEINKNAIKICEKNGHLVCQNIESFKQKFDVISMFDVFEHLYSPLNFLDNIINKLNDNGFLMILTGNPSCITSKLTGSKWWYARYPEHIVLPSIIFLKIIVTLQIHKIIRCYANQSHERISRNKIKIATNLLRGNYNGSPAITKDHIFVIFKKNSNESY